MVSYCGNKRQLRRFHRFAGHPVRQLAIAFTA